MKFTSNAAAVFLAASLVVSYAQTSGTAPQVKRHTTPMKAKTPPPPSVADQINALRQDLQSQIDALKNALADKDTQLRQAQQTAADAQAAAAKAESDATTQQQAFTANTAAVTTLQSTVDDLKGNQLSLTSTLSDETSAIKKSIANPDAIHFKGAMLSFTGSFIAAETTWRSAADGSDVNTSFTGIPLQNADAAQMTEFYGTGRQSRLAFKATGKIPSMTMTGYYEMDWLGTGITSNSNGSNSYVLRQRQLWADAKTNSGWDFSGGQGWSLATETTQGLTRGTEILPSTIDAQYEPGFVWNRQYSFRISKNIGQGFFIGASAENAETLNPTGNGIPLNEFIGSAGVSGGLFNPTANYSFNYAPDMIAKIAFEPGWGHWELFGIQRTFRDRIYPNEVCTSTAVSSGAGVSVTSCTGNTIGAWNDKEIGAGIGGGFRAPLAGKYATVGLKGLWGQGMGRYGSSTIADVTIRPDGQLSPIHGFSALSTVELNPTSRFTMYFNYGGDYLDRDYVLNGTTQVGYGARSVSMTGCNTEPAPSGTNNTYGGNGTGFDPSTPGSCGANNRDVQEFTAGYWFNIHNSPAGRLRQGIQYSLIRRDLWSGAGGTTNPSNGAHGDDNMLFTSFRYYLP
jgi:hypothetical protein